MRRWTAARLPAYVKSERVRIGSNLYVGVAVIGAVHKGREYFAVTLAKYGLWSKRARQVVVFAVGC